jgi:hypothetical protein
MFSNCAGCLMVLQIAANVLPVAHRMLQLSSLCALQHASDHDTFCTQLTFCSQHRCHAADCPLQAAL